MRTLELGISSLGARVVDARGVRALRAEDASGSFGVLPGHADFLTLLGVGVVSWQDGDGAHYCAVRGGVLTVQDGCRVQIATREAIADDDLDRLESTVLTRFHDRDEAERSARTESTRAELRAVRQILRYLQPQRGTP